MSARIRGQLSLINSEYTMKTVKNHLLASAVGISLIAPLVLLGQDSSDTLDTLQKQRGYAIGVNMANSIINNDIDAELAYAIKGLSDKLEGKSLLQTDDETKAVLNEISREIIERRNKERQAAEAARQEKGQAAKAAGEAFLKEKAQEDGVQSTGSGLLYKVITQGDGPRPSKSDTVTVHYRGTLIDGTEFDSSFKRNAPAKFGVGNVIKGWTEALQLMPVGSKWELYIPSDLAYGTRGQGDKIVPNSTLVFEVELIETASPVSKPKTSGPITSDIIRVPSAEGIKKGEKVEIIPKDKIDEYRQKETDSSKKE